ncbi:hypothetical protein CSQ96_12275 [Janthinobacterium sp. BJB412]|nr:hypothetical protein CSQ96_12275 [Janthinobacterium sp. BJB412]
MSTIALFDYTLTKSQVANPDHTHAATVTACAPLAVTVNTAYGALAGALSFAAGSAIVAPFPVTAVDAQRFAVRVIFRATGPVTARQNLIESTCLPFSIHLLPGAGAGAFQIQATVNNARNSWSGAATLARVNLQLGIWYAVDLVFDIDTLALFVDKQRIALGAFPSGALTAPAAGELVIGVHPDKVRWHFVGDMARVQVFADIPHELEALEDAGRSTGEWHIRLKENAVAGSLALGAPQGDISYLAFAGMEVQHYQQGMIGYTDGYPAAFALHGPIYERYMNGAPQALLGGLVSDVQPARARGSLRAVFEGGAIYWGELPGALEVMGRFHLDYEQLGGSVSVLGLPVTPPDNIAGGQIQVFERGHMYLRNGASNAFEMHGAILAAFMATGSTARWGFPTTHETDVLPGGGAQSVGRQSQLEAGTFLWSAATGAHAVYGAIRDTYLARGGAATPFDQGGLGFPTSDEQPIPGVGGFARYNTFQRGAIFFRDGAIDVATPFTFYLGMLSTSEDEGWGQGQNDLYLFAEIWRNGARVFDQRMPSSDAWDGDNSHDIGAHLPTEIVPNDPALAVELRIDVWDEDGGFGGGDDHVGQFSKLLTVANGWGLFDNAAGIFEATNVSGIRSLRWAIQPVLAPNTPKDFWGAVNQGTPALTFPQYDAAFSDIDDDPEWSDPGDWAEEDFFSKSIQAAASNGNCFGMCVEALHAWNGNSLFSLPLNRFNAWPTVVNDFNIKQIYWFGSDCLWFTDTQIKEQNLTAAQVFQRSRQSAGAGNPAVLYFYSNANFSGSGHAVLATDWDNSVTPWTITVFDPNQRNVKQQVMISPTGNAFSFNSAGLSFGGAAGTGAIGFVPFSTVNHRQASAVWDPTLLLLAGLVVALGADASTESISDSAGGNLWMNANHSGDARTYRNQFWSAGTLDGQMTGEVLLRRVLRSSTRWNRARALSTPVAHLLAAMRRPSPEDGRAAALNPQPLPPRLATLLMESGLADTMLAHTLQELAVMSGAGNCPAEPPLCRDDRNGGNDHDAGAGRGTFPHGVDPAIGAAIDTLRRQSSSTGGDFTHIVRGRRRGQFDYLLKHKLAETRLRAALDRGEAHTVDASGVGGSQPITRVLAGRDKTMQLEHLSRIGTSADFMRLRIANLPLRAGLDMHLSVRPGLAAVDVVTAGERIDAAIEIETMISGVRQVRNFNCPMEGGLRLLPRTVFDSGGLKAGRIDMLFGDIRNTLFLP